jgi:membrane protease YdiL (CAAX protease family)
MKILSVLCLLAGLFWFIIFSPWTFGRLNFWAEMVMATGVLAGAALFLGRKDLPSVYRFRRSHLVIGIGSAAVLYLVFLIGDAISTQIFSFAKPEVSSIYRSREQASSLIIGILLFLWIGPAEEVFWRGFIQHRLSKRFGEIRGYLVSSLIYAGVHIWAFNLMLFLAALICGLFWGALFKRYRSVWPGLISHALWDVAIFVLFPVL